LVNAYPLVLQAHHLPQHTVDVTLYYGGPSMRAHTMPHSLTLVYEQATTVMLTLHTLSEPLMKPQKS
jgi:hypothetical protein